MINYRSDGAKLGDIEEIVLKGIVQRASLLSLVFSVAFPVYGMTSFMFIQKFDSAVTAWNNTYPRIIVNGIPFLCLSLFMRNFNKRTKLKAWTWAVAWPLIFYAAAWIWVSPIMMRGQTEIYLYVHAANTMVFALCFMLVAQTPSQMLASFLALLASHVAISLSIFKQAGDDFLFRYFLTETIFYFVLLSVSGYISFKLRYRLAEHEVWQTDQIVFRDQEIERKTKEALDLEVSARVGKLATQIAHDMKSPLAALNVIRRMDLQDLTPAKEYGHKIIALHAMDRLTEIADTLLDKEKLKTALANEGGVDGRLSGAALNGVVAALTREKKTEHQAKTSISITYASTLTGAANPEATFTVEPKELCVILSNLVNNSVEACEKLGRGSVEVKLTLAEHAATIQVTDNGNGIEPALVPLLGSQGATFGKVKGLGLGLHHAKTQVEKWGGELTINSKFGFGTCLSLTLPKSRSS